MKEIDEKGLENSIETLFGKSGDSDGMWKIASKYALQLDQLQIQALTKLTFIANMCGDKRKNQLIEFRDYYISLQNNRNTALYISKLAEYESLKRYFTGIQGQIKIEK